MTHYIVVPDNTAFLTAGVDVASDRIEILIKGWGAGPLDKSIDVLRARLKGDPWTTALWDVVDDLLDGNYVRENGSPVAVAAAAIDPGLVVTMAKQFCHRAGVPAFLTKRMANAPQCFGNPTDILAYVFDEESDLEACARAAAWHVGSLRLGELHYHICPLYPIRAKH